MVLAQLQMNAAQVMMCGVFTRMPVFLQLNFAVPQQNLNVKLTEYQYAYLMRTVAKLMNNGVI